MAIEKTINWGILGTGSIAKKFAADLQFVEDAKLIAVGSRTAQSAAAFANEYAIPNGHGSYKALVADKEVDVIYIASPHTMHFEHTLLCLNHGKAVLCEKPFAINLHQTKQMITLAKEKGLFLMEALWTKFLPHYIAAKKLVNDGAIGDVKAVTANFGFRPVPPINPRMFDLALGGGTIMDIGVYNIFMALGFLGKPDKIDAVMIPTKDNVDEQCSITFSYNNGAMASLFSSFVTGLAIEASINGTTGRIKFTNRFYEPSSDIELTDFVSWKTTQIEVEKGLGFGYHYEALHVTQCLLKGMTESDIHTFEDTINLITVMDEVKRKAGVIYEADK